MWGQPSRSHETDTPQFFTLDYWQEIPMPPKRFTFEANDGQWTVSYDSLGPIIAIAKSLQQTHQPYRIYTKDAEGDLVDGQQVWHDGLTQVEREVLLEAGVL